MTKYWYALRLKRHKASSVLERLSTDDVEGYLPLVRVQPKNPRAAKLKPYLPGYLFVHTDLEDLSANKFRWLPGAIGLVEFGGIPAVVPENLISELQRLMDRINKEGGLAHFELKPGDRVRIVDGPFAGYDAIFDMHLSGKDRVQVLLAFLSQSPQPVNLNSSAIKKINK